MAATAMLTLLPFRADAQTRDITGKVTQAGTGQPIPDATVSVVGQQVGVRTNDRGEYRLRVPSGEVLLQARTLGYKRVTARVAAGQGTADFSLEKDVLQLEGVSVTGQATTVDRKVAATAVATVSTGELNRVPARSIESNLAGKVAGARMFENSGAPGGGAQIQIRGATSVLGSGDPLYVVDGVIISNASITSGASSITRASGSTGSTQDQVVNRLADLNPNDIETIEVLKSAAASAIYGSRATNGVVVITTKRGKQGRSSWNVVQRMGTQQAQRLLGHRRYGSYDEVKPYVGGVLGDSIARAACGTGACPFYDWQQQLYGRTDPSWETLLSAAGGANNTRFFVSLNDRQESGIMVNTGARRTGGRINIDQTLGSKWTVSTGLDVTRNFFQRGFGNNDNAGISPIYNMGYNPAIIDLQARDAAGRYVRMPFYGGSTVPGLATSNPFEVLTANENTESVWRQAGSTRVGYTAYSGAKNSVQLSYLAGVDRFQQEGYQYSPNYMQYEPADGFLGTANQLNASSYQFNHGVNAVWTYTPGWSWLTSATTSVGGTYENQKVNIYSLRGRGLLPTRKVPIGAQDLAVTNSVSEFRDQSYYLNEQLLLFSEKLSLNAGLRADRSSANGDRTAFYSFPKFSGSYRLVKPLTDKVDEVKFRAAWGQSGNRPRYGDRDVLYADGGLIGGAGSLVSAGLLGNPKVKPEVMNELEFGADATLLGGRMGLEFTRYQRKITDLLLTFPLPPSSGLGSQIINGGQLSVLGTEAVLSAVPLRRGNLEWTTRVIYSANAQFTDNIPVPAFAVGGSFGAAYGRNRIAPNTRSTFIWGNAPLGANGAVRDTILFDSNPIHTTVFNNDVTWGRWTVSVLADWRNGGYSANMTNNLWDEGGQSRDFVAAGKARYDTFNKGDIRPYIQNGTYVKLREVSLNYQAPDALAQKIPGARSLRLNLSGRNLAIFSKYWSFDPEFNNFGNTNFNRFIDLAPFPSSRQYFFSVDVGF
ncbi:MAG: SusC/RagA family TonB-linked outer membrane protein [Gemmatimonadetes bacterium]|nr:SusC/RagA family TonB-linked outer membrane protein [Gemmatimonadota bacterium]